MVDATVRTGGDLVVDVRDRVATVTLNRPERRNALSRGLLADLVGTVDDLGRDDEVWVVVLTGAGDRAFSAGMDLKEMREGDQADARPRVPMTGPSRNHCEVVLECPKPTVAVLNGAAMGGGFELAMACDLRIAADHVLLGLPEAKRGLAANFGSQLLPRLLPSAIAYEVLYLGEPLTADDARRWGLVNQVVPGDELAAAAQALTSRLVANAPLALRRYKQMVTKGRDLPLPAALRLDVGPNPYLSADRVEGVAAFNDGRAPAWQGR